MSIGSIAQQDGQLYCPNNSPKMPSKTPAGDQLMDEIRNGVRLRSVDVNNGSQQAAYIETDPLRLMLQRIRKAVEYSDSESSD